MKRFGLVIGIKEEKIEEYKELHSNVWPDVLNVIKACNIQNYSIYLRQMPDGKFYLFSYFEYVGENFEADMSKMSKDETTQRWWDVCKPCQTRLPACAEGEHWAPMEEVFYCE